MDWLLGIVSAASGSTTLLLAGGLIWAVREARQQGNLAIAAAKDTLEARKETAEVAKERDTARASLAQRDAELATAAKRLDELQVELDVTRRKNADADTRAVREETDPDRRVRLANDILRRHAEEDAARAGRTGSAATVALRPAGPATDGPVPAWVGAADD